MYSSSWQLSETLKTDTAGNHLFLRPYGLCHDAHTDVLHVADCKFVQSLQLSAGHRLNRSVQLQNPCSLARESRGGRLFAGEYHGQLEVDSVHVMDCCTLDVHCSFGSSSCRDVTELCLLPNESVLVAATDAENSPRLFTYTEAGELLRSFSPGAAAESICYCRGMLYSLKSASEEDGLVSAVTVLQLDGHVVQVLLMPDDVDLVDVCATTTGLFALDYVGAYVNEFLFV